MNSKELFESCGWKPGATFQEDSWVNSKGYMIAFPPNTGRCHLIKDGQILKTFFPGDIAAIYKKFEEENYL